VAYQIVFHNVTCMYINDVCKIMRNTSRKCHSVLLEIVGGEPQILIWKINLMFVKITFRVEIGFFTHKVRQSRYIRDDRFPKAIANIVLVNMSLKCFALFMKKNHFQII